MRIITWNCNISAAIRSSQTAAKQFVNKCTHIEELQPDIAVYQEMAQPDPVSTTNYIWHGDSLNRGIAVCAHKDYHLEAVDLGAPLRSVLPVRVIGEIEFNLLAVWSRPEKTSYRNYVQEILGGLEIHREFLKSGPSVVAGDFNSNARWNKDAGKINHASLMEVLENDFGLVSAYHTKFELEHGEELEPTFHMYRHADKGFHIDYYFVPNSWQIATVEIGELSDWKANSDHCPLIINVISRK